MFPAMEPVESLSPLWFTARAMAARKWSSGDRAESAARRSGQYSVKPDGERFLRDPALAQVPHQFLRRQDPRCRVPECRLEPLREFRRHVLEAAHLVQDRRRRVLQAVAGHQAVDQQAEAAGTLPGGGMAVGQGGGVGTQLIDGVGRYVGNQAERRGPHHGAAALGVGVYRPVNGPHFAGGQSADARVSRCAAVPQDLMAVDPALRLHRGRRRHRLALGVQPTEVRQPEAGVHIGPHAVVGPFQRLHQSVHRVQRHLRVVRKVAAAVEHCGIRHAGGAETAADRLDGVELHRVAQRVTQGAAQQAAVDSGRQRGRGGARINAHTSQFTVTRSRPAPGAAPAIH